MSSISAKHFNEAGSIIGMILDEKSSYPVKNLQGVGLDISNKDGSKDLLFRIGIRGTQDITADYGVSAGGELNELFPPFDSFDIVQPSASFIIIIRNPK